MVGFGAAQTQIRRHVGGFARVAAQDGGLNQRVSRGVSAQMHGLVVDWRQGQQGMLSWRRWDQCHAQGRAEHAIASACTRWTAHRRPPATAGGQIAWSRDWADGAAGHGRLCCLACNSQAETREGWRKVSGIGWAGRVKQAWAAGQSRAKQELRAAVAASRGVNEGAWCRLAVRTLTVQGRAFLLQQLQPVPRRGVASGSGDARQNVGRQLACMPQRVCVCVCVSDPCAVGP